MHRFHKFGAGGDTCAIYNALGSSLAKENQGIRQIVIKSDEGV